jgi:polyketide biosynthesis enoyl-CoA hydratase PksI
MAEKVHIIRSCDGIYELKIDDAEDQNRLGDLVCEELQAALTELTIDSDIRVLVLTGRPEVFCAGATLGLLRKLATGKALEDLGLPLLMLSFPVPILAALEGPAVGGGLALAICCDILIAAESARYGFNFTDMGFTPGMGTTSLLPVMTGHAFAMEMLLTAKYYKGRELKGRGIFSHVVRADEVRGLTWDIARAMAEKERPVLEMVKDTLTMPRRLALQEALSRERLMHKLSFGRPEIWSAIRESYRENNEGKRESS